MGFYGKAVFQEAIQIIGKYNGNINYGVLLKEATNSFHYFQLLDTSASLIAGNFLSFVYLRIINVLRVRSTALQRALDTLLIPKSIFNKKSKGMFQYFGNVWLTLTINTSKIRPLYCVRLLNR